MVRRRPKLYLFASIVLASVMATSGLGGAAPSGGWRGEAKRWTQQERSRTPEDRYAMAGGCYAVRSADAGFVTRSEDSFAASADPAAAEPFHLQATDLGRYLLFGTQEDFLAASEGALAEAVYTVTESTPGATAGGVVLEKTDEAADAIADGEANRASGRGADVVSAPNPSELADWTIDQVGDNAFTFYLEETDQMLAAGPDGSLTLVGPGEGTVFGFFLTDGCAGFPEIEVNVSGPVVGGANLFQEVRGFMDLHLHMMAFEFLGGRARCGRPWHPYGVEYALVDCPDHEPGGHGAVLEAALSGGDPVKGHNTDGWPTFEGWPKHNSLTHEQVYYKWMERAWRGGLRLFVNLLVDNNQLCKIYPYKRNSCNEMDGVRLQAKRIHQLQNYIDAQSGGPGEGWFRIVDDPFEAREIINQGKLAVVLGIEVSVPLDCGETLEIPRCDLSDVESGLDEVYDLGVRQMELVNKFDNALSGVAGDAGTTGVIVNNGNKLETGHYWKMDTCEEEDGHEGHAHDKTQYNFHDQSGAPDEFSGRDALAGGILALSGASGVAPVYPEGPHCNTIGLSDLGEAMIKGMAERGMIFDPDHMSAKARAEALDVIDEIDHPGLVSSHGWADEVSYRRIYELGGVITPYAGGAQGFVENWREHRAWADDRYYFGFGYGADTNGFGSQGGPRGLNASNPVTYPFTGFGGVTVEQQQSGTRTYDVNVDGVAHYGLYPDWIEDLRRLAGDQIIEDMERGPEAYLQMWERAVGIAPDACRSDVPDLRDDDFRRLSRGMTPEQVLRTLGQPSSRLGNDFVYCVEGGRTGVVTFTDDGSLQHWNVRGQGYTPTRG